MYKSLNAVQRDVMLQLLLKANHEHRKWEWKGKLFECQPGEFITSIDSIKKACAQGTSTKNVRTALTKLELWNFLANESASTGRKITIVNWDRYQNSDDGYGKPTGRKTADKGQTTGKRPATNKNNKEVKNEKNNIYTDKFLTFWKEYPNKKAKGAAFKAWKKIPAHEYELLFAGL